MLGEDRRGPEAPEAAVKHQLLFGLYGLCVAGMSPHQHVHHRHLDANEKQEKQTMRLLIEERKDKRKHPRQKSHLLFMRQERHQGQRPPRLHTFHH